MSRASAGTAVTVGTGRGDAARPVGTPGSAAATGADAATGPRPHSQPRRVLQVITKLDMGGAEVIALDLVASLHGRADFAVATVMDFAAPSPVGQDMAARLAMLEVPVFPGARGHFKKGGVLVSAWRLAQAVTRFRPDIIHLHTEMPELTWAVASVFSPGLRRVPVVRTVHNSELWIDWAGIGSWVTDRLARGRAIAVSEAAADADAGIRTNNPRPRAQVAYNGLVPPPRVLPRTGSGAFHLLFAGRLIEQKAPDLLPGILAAAHGLTARRDVKVTVAGTGPLESTVREALRGIAPGWTIRMVAPIERLSDRLGDYDAVLMPSRYEGFGLLAAEALMAGVPVVATRAPGLNEILPADYPLGAAVDDVAALGRLVATVIDDPATAHALVAPLRDQLATRFSAHAMVERYAQAYGVAVAEPAA